MRKFLFAFLALAACASDNGPGDDDGNGGDTGDGGGGGSGGGGGGGGGDDVSTTDTQRDYDDVAAAVGARVSAGELGVMIDAVNVSYGRVPAGFTYVQTGSKRVYQGSRGGLALEYEAYCRDAADVIVPCDGAAYHGHFTVEYNGSIAGAGMDGLQRKAVWSIRDLLTATPRIGGKGTDAFGVSVETGDYTIAISDTLDRVRLQASPTGPTSGTIALVANIERTRASASPASRTFSVNALVEFSAGETAMITLDGSEKYMVTLATGAVVKH